MPPSEQRAWRVDALPELESEDLLARLKALFASPDYRPPRLPSVGVELLALCKEPEVPFERVEQLLGRDAVLAGEALRLAHSGAFPRSAEPLTLRSALVRLGLVRLTELVFAAALKLRVFRAPGYDELMAQLLRHSLATAFAARQLARQTAFPDEHAFLCGLLHDVGAAGAALLVAESGRPSRRPALELVLPVLNELHGEAGRRMAEAWRLPPDVALVIAQHDQFVVGGRAHPLAAIVHLASLAADELDAPSGLPEPARAEAARDAVGLSKTQYLVAAQLAGQELAKVAV